VLEINQIHEGDCLELMKEISNKSINLILCDLPYGKTECEWDSTIDLRLLWKQYKRVLKDDGIIVLTATIDFALVLINSNQDMFRYDLIWDKKLPTGFLNANRQPLRVHEHILIFYNKLGTYNPIKRKGIKRSTGGKIYSMSECYNKISKPKQRKIYDEYYPTSILRFGNANQKKKEHPTQKPLELFNYLIKTYSNKGDLILDNCIGSGTTAVACKQLYRNFIGIEKERKYCKIANQRLSQEVLLV